jgi:hypothetical protein
MLARYTAAVDDDGERYHLEEAEWKLAEWLKKLSPSQARGLGLIPGRRPPTDGAPQTTPGNAEGFRS